MIVDIFLSFLAFFLYLQLGLYVLFTKPGTRLNRAFFYLCMSLVIWSFGFMFIHASSVERGVVFWERVSSFGWIFFPCLLVYFFFVLKRTSNILFRFITQLAFFLAAVLFFIQSLLGNLLTEEYVYISGRWVFKPDLGSIWYLSFMVYLVSSLAVSFYLLIKWSLTSSLVKERKQSRIIMITLTLYFAGILGVNYVLPVISPIEFPTLIHITSFFWVTGFSFAIVRYKFLVLSPQAAANEIINEMKELLFFLNNEGKVIRVNSFTEEVLGFEASEIINCPFEGMLIEKEEAKALLAAQDDLEEVKPHDYYIRKKNNEVVPFNLSSAIVKDEAGDVLGTIIVGYDVRYKKMLEQALTESERKYKKLYSMVSLMCDNVPDLIWAKDLDKRYIFANKATREMLLDADVSEEVIGKADEIFFTRAKAVNTEDKIWFSYNEKGGDSDLLTIETKKAGRFLESGTLKGNYVYMDVHKAPFWDENNRIIGLVGCGRDVTGEKRIEKERLRAEQQLSREKERLSVTLNSIGDGVISTDIQGNVLMMNKVAEELTGWTKCQAEGKPIDDVFVMFGPRKENIRVYPVTSVLKSGRIIEFDKKSFIIGKEGQRINLACNGAPISDQEGKTIGVVIAFSDITQKLRIEQELMKVQKLETVGVLAGGIAHDFNNILTAIMGNVSLVMLKLGAGNSNLTKRLNDAEKACCRARDLIKQLLTFTKGGEPVTETVRLNKLLEDTVRFAIKGSGIDYQFDIAEDLKGVEADESQICQVINNLIINAEQAMPQGGLIQVKAKNVELSSETALPLPAGEFVMIEVIDSGIGIPKERLEKIFDLFHTSKETGTGLGLALSLRIISRHNGHIEAESQEGKGTRFVVYLPASQKEYKAGQVEEEDLSFRGEGTLIVMDDQVEIRETIQNMLHSIGFHVICTANGEETLNELKKAKNNKEEIKALIVDLIIQGGLDGKETIKRIRKSDSELKVIVSSGFSNDPIMANYAEYGFDGVIAKPYTMGNLLKALKEVIEP